MTLPALEKDDPYMQKIISNALGDTYLIMYRFYRTMRRSESTGKATGYAEEFVAYFFALIMFDVAFVPIGTLMAYFNVPFAVTRYTLLAGGVLVIYLSKKKALAMMGRQEADDKILVEQYEAITIGRWLAWVMYLLLSLIPICALGFFYSYLARWSGSR